MILSKTMPLTIYIGENLIAQKGKAGRIARPFLYNMDLLIVFKSQLKTQTTQFMNQYIE